MIRFLKSPALPVLLACALLQLPATLRAQTPDKAASLFGDPVVATGKGFEIKRSQLDDAFINYSANAEAGGSAIPEGERPSVRSKLLENLIFNKILMLKATPEDKTAVTKLVEQEIAQARSNAPSPEDFDARIKARGMTVTQVRDQEVEKQLAQRVLVHDLTNGIVIADVDVKNFYQTNMARFKLGERVRAQHVLISTLDPVTHEPLPPDKKKEKQKLAGEVKAKADKGEDFAALVKKYSDDTISISKGGEYTFAKDSRLPPEFIAAAFTMKTNQVSDLVETKYGYHIIKLLEKIPPTTVDFAKAESDIRGLLLDQEAKKGLPAYLEKIRASADVKIVGQDGAKADAGKSSPVVK
jgi:parvulin-like peptidyl-prolyl isomerase